MAADVSKLLEYDADAIQQLVETVYGLLHAYNFNKGLVWLNSLHTNFMYM